MVQLTPDFTLEVEGVAGVCPAGEVYAKQTIADKKIPVFSCEGPCIRGDIARLAANLIAHWVKGSEKTVMIDGCFLKCHGRILKKLIGEDKVVHIDALPLYKKYTDIVLMDDVPEEERKAVARQVADKITVMLKEDKRLEGAIHASS